MNSQSTANRLNPAILDVPQSSTGILLIVAGIVALLIGVGAFTMSRPRNKARIAAGYNRAFEWIDRATTAWHEDGRLTDDEARRLRTELHEPDFTAVLPHFGVHLTIGVFLRFPFGSLVRGTYVLASMGLAHIRFVTRRIDYRTFRRLLGIHSPLVLILASFPGIGTFAYLASKPFRSHHLLARVALDAVLLRLPRNVYERTGLRMAIARPGWSEKNAGAETIDGREPGVRFRIVPAWILLVLGLIACGLFAIDVVMQAIEHKFAPSFLGWEPIYRILDLNSEASFGTWFAVMTLVLCSAMLAIIAYARHVAGERFARHWGVLALLVLGLSIDEQAKLHDLGSGVGGRMREILGLGGVLYYGWVIVAFVSIIILVLAYWRFVFSLPVAIRNSFIVAGAFYVGGEMGMEMISGWVMDHQGDTLLYRTTTSFEEFFGMIGTLIAFGTLLVHARTVVGTVSLRVAGAGVKPVNRPVTIGTVAPTEPALEMPNSRGVTAIAGDTQLTHASSRSETTAGRESILPQH